MSGDPVWSLRKELPDLATNKPPEETAVVYQVRASLCPMSKLDLSDIGSVMFVSLCEYSLVIDQSLLPCKYPEYPGKASFEEPDHLVQVVEGNVRQGGHRTKGLKVSSLEGSHGSSILTGRHREGGVGIREQVGEVSQLVYYQKGGASRNRRWHWRGENQNQKYTAKCCMFHPSVLGY